MHAFKQILLLSALAAVGTTVTVQAKEKDLNAEKRPEAVVTVEGITEYRLDNGLRVVLYPDESKPTATVNMTYLVGSRHENYGETGMAHLLEHLMFKGSKNYPNPTAEFTKRGFRMNGTTWLDRTNYFVSFTANDDNMKWALGWQADSMTNAFIAKKDLDTEMTVVRNEYEMGENRPVSVMLKRMQSVLFDWHSYGRNTIGARSDIENVEIENLQAFYRRYYQPDNAVLVTAITDPAGRSTQFSYYQGGLTYITFADGELVRLIYDYNSYLIQEIRGVDNTRLKINYDNSGQKRVRSVNWGASDDQLLESYSFRYRQNETKITDIQNRSYTYQFNDYGQTTGVVSDTDGTAQFFELEQGNDPGNAKANKLLAESRVLKSVTNFAVNPGFTRALSDGYGTYIESASGGTVTVDSGMKNLTNNAVKITKPAGNAGRANAVQYIDGLAAGTYTFSGFVHTNGAEIPGEGASLFAEVWNAANTGLISSNWAEAVSKTDGWQRQSVTFTVPEGGRVRLLVGLHNNASGTVWYDDLQLEKGENTTVEVIEKICLKLGCGVDDIMEIVPDSPANGTETSVK